MSYTKNTLPVELVLDIVANIKNWQDRLQFAMTSKRHWNCINNNLSLREAQIATESNLLKLKVARSLVFSPTLRIDRGVNKATRVISISNRLKTLVVTEGALTASQIKCIMKAASQRSNIEIVVPASSYAHWTSILNDQKFKLGQVIISCDAEDEEPTILKEEIHQSKLVDYLRSVNYSKCSHTKQSIEYISQNPESVVANLGNYFTGSIICFSNVKILVSSLDVFIHVNGVDDCAFSRIWINDFAFAKLHLKSEMGNDFCELSIIVDKCVELLAVGGLCMINGGSVEPFLGSSVKPLNRAQIIDGDLTTTNILVKKNTQVARSERLLRQYFKRDSYKQWSFHLKLAFDVGFYPVNPLHVNDHPSVSSVELSLQSALLWMYCKKEIDQSLLTTMFRAISGSTIMKKRLKLDSFEGHSFQQIYDAKTITGKWKTIVGIAKDLEVGQVNFDTDKKAIMINKKVVLQLVKNGFLQTLSRINDKNCVQFKSKIQN